MGEYFLKATLPTLADAALMPMPFQTGVRIYLTPPKTPKPLFYGMFTKSYDGFDHDIRYNPQVSGFGVSGHLKP